MIYLCHSGNMKHLVVSLMLAACFCAATSVGADEAMSCKVTAKFSSQDNMAAAVLDALRAADKRITVALYGFNNKEFADELAKLARKGIAVRVKIDTAKSSEKKTGQLIQTLRGAGAHVQTAAPGGRNHNKFAVIDGKTVLTGSYNWTLKAETNWENLLIIDCPELAKSYEAEWEKIR